MIIESRKIKSKNENYCNSGLKELKREICNLRKELFEEIITTEIILQKQNEMVKELLLL